METNDDKIKKQAGHSRPEENFKVPHNYFDTFSGRVKEKIEARTSPARRNVWAWLAKPAFALPATLVVLAVAAWFIFSTPQTVVPAYTASGTTETVDTLSTGAIENYLVAEMNAEEIDEELNEEMLVLAIDDTPQPGEKATPATLDNSISEEEIEDYLINYSDESLFENL